MKRRMKRVISSILTVMLTFSLTVGTSLNKAKAAELSTEQIHSILSKKINTKFSSQDLRNRFYQKNGVTEQFDDNKPVQNSNPDELVRVVVQLEQAPLLENSSKSLTSLQSLQNTVKSKVKALDGADIRHTYSYVVNGFSMTVKRSEISKIRAISGVKNVTEAKAYYPDMTSAKSLTQAYDTWKDLGYKGEGMVVAIIDSGIDVTHKDMKITDTSKDKLTKDNVLKGNDKGKFFTDKVPYGYNFADQNFNIIDTNPQVGMHGMHVAGIVGANASEEEVKNLEGVQGVAPEAQLLAMKVFSNNPNFRSAFSDDIIAAIEDSVLHGADVINMSLGSTAAFQDPEDPEQEAIKNAVDHGTMVVVSAGNSYTSTYPYKIPGVPDTGLVGSPGIAHDSLQVASYENTQVTAPALSYTSSAGNGLMAYFTSDVNPLGVLNGEYSLVDCGYGQVGDFDGKDLKGKIALIQRGGKTSKGFVEKKQLAQAAGAIGVIVYNDAARGDAYISMATDPSITIPAVFIGNTDGKYLLANISSVKVSFQGKVKSVANSNSNDMSDFTSWGPTPNLDFKPEISAPGGNIYSTVNNNQYESMSGTSMAAPHTSGAEALIIQAIKNNNPTISGRDLVEFAKADTINTAKTEMDKLHPTVPYSPRRQGAGLVQIKDAINNNVIVTDENDEATVSLKEIGKTKTFNLKLKNYGNTPATYTLENIGGVLSETSRFLASMSYDVAINGATATFDKNTVTVPANGNASVTVTINLPDNFMTEQFVEGFVKFRSSDSKPSLVVPYMGFYGDWSKPISIDKPIWDPSYLGFGSTLLGKVYNYENDSYDYDYLGFEGLDKYKSPIINPEEIGISPNGDDDKDTVVPYLSFLRNVKDLVEEVTDSNGNVVRQIAVDNNIRKNLFITPGQEGKFDDNWGWDGTIYNPDTGKYDVAPEGQYYINIKSKIDFDGAEEQILTMPVKVDVTAPEVEVKSADKVDNTKYTLQWTASDEGVGAADGVVALVNDNFIDNLQVSETDGVYSTDLNLNNGYNDIWFAVSDYADNMTLKHLIVKVGDAPLSIKFENLESGMITNSDVVGVYGYVNYPVKSLEINGVPAEFGLIFGQEVPVFNKMFYADITPTLVQGTNYVSVKAIGLDNEELANYSIKMYYDTISPVVNLTKPTIGEDGKVYINELTNNKYTVSGTASDNTFGYKLFVNGDQKLNVNLNDPDENATRKDFSYQIPVTANSKYLEVKAVDLVGNEYTSGNLELVLNAPIVNVAGVKDGGLYNTSVTPTVALNNEAYTYSMKLNGQEYVEGTPIDEDGNYTLEVTALNGEFKSVYTVNFALDKTAPTMPELTANITVPTNQDVTVTSKYSDDTVEKEYKIDNGVWKTYTAPIKVTANCTVYARGTDAAGNVSGVTSLVVSNIDKEAPNKPHLTPDNGTLTNGNVTVTIDSWGDASVKEYKVNDGQWQPYTAPVVMTENGTIYARGTDAAGNASEVASLTIANIDKTPPTKPALTPSTTVPTNTDITVTIGNWGDAAVKEYKVNDGQWQPYTAPVVMTENGTIYARGTDAAGNVSEVATLTINNIDKTAPAVPTITPSTTNPTNKDITVEIKAEDKASIKYSFDNSNWVNYTTPVTIAENTKVYAKAVDLAGNVSTVSMLDIKNIDKVAPVITVNGVENDKTYGNKAKANVSVNDGNVTVKLNGNAYNGEDITAAGDYTLVVDAVDAVGNISTKTIKFAIKAVLSSGSTEDAVNALAKSSDKQIEVSLDNTTIVDDSLFKAVAGQDKNVSFTVNSNNTTLTWTFNAKEIDPNNIKDIDLSLNVQAPNKDTIEKIDSNAQIISFKENGVLPAPATIKIKLDSTKMDLTKEVYFYYYNPTTKTTELIAGPLTPDKDGYVEVTVKHNSDYFFSNNDNQKTTAAVASLPKTGSLLDMNVLVGIGILLTAIGTLFVVRRRRTE